MVTRNLLLRVHTEDPVDPWLERNISPAQPCPLSAPRLGTGCSRWALFHQVNWRWAVDESIQAQTQAWSLVALLGSKSQGSPPTPSP